MDDEKHLTRQYLLFYLPLTLTGLAMLLAQQFKNGVLARYPDATRELALFAYATSIFFLFQAAVMFVPQMANVLARSRQSRSVCFRFTVLTSLVLTAPIAALAFTPLGRPVLTLAFDIRGETLDTVILYLRFLSPLILVNALRQFYTGLLVQSRRTGVVTLLNAVFLAATVGALVAGFVAGWRAVHVIALAQILSAGIHWLLSWGFCHLLYRLPEEASPEALTYAKAFTFFWPVAVTAGMFALSRPVIYSFVSRMPGAQTYIAALRVGFDFGMIFHAPLNQFRNLFVTFGDKDLSGVRTFMARTMIVLSVLMVLVVMTPVHLWILRGLLGIEGELLTMASEVITVLCLVPLVITLRNYFHGLHLIHRRTRGMAAGGVLRVVAIYIASFGLYHAGILNHSFGALVLVAGFAVEALTVVASTKLWPQKDRTLAAMASATEDH
jgi:hypothetical protein